MALIPAAFYGAQNSIDRFGHSLVANDGNGDMYGENEVISRLSYNGSEKLDDIMELRVQMAMCPIDGDDHITALLDLDEHLLKTGKIDHELITDLYPDIGEYLYGLLMEDVRTAEAVGEILEPLETAHSPEFPESPEEVLLLLENLAAREADKVLSVLLETSIEQQSAAIHELKGAEETSQSPFVAA